MGITIIFGKPRVGKTALMTHFLTENMCGVKAVQSIRSCKKIISELNHGGFHFNAPQKHIVYANYDIEYTSKFCYKRKNYEIDPFKIGFKNDEFETTFIAPYATIGIMEAQRYYNSRRCDKTKDAQSGWFEKHGHAGMNIFMDCQRYKLIDPNIREIADRIIEVCELTHIYDKKHRIKKSIWKCRVFDSSNEADSYLESGKKDNNLYTNQIFVHEGNIFNCYESQSCFLSFIKGREKEQISYKPFEKFSNNVESLKRYTKLYPDDKKIKKIKADKQQKKIA